MEKVKTTLKDNESNIDRVLTSILNVLFQAEIGLVQLISLRKSTSPQWAGFCLREFVVARSKAGTKSPVQGRVKAKDQKGGPHWIYWGTSRSIGRKKKPRDPRLQMSPQFERCLCAHKSKRGKRGKVLFPGQRERTGQGSLE